MESAMTELQKKQQQIYCLKADLAATDYKLFKFMEGLLAEDEYAPIKEQRAVIRENINDLEEEIIKLEAEEAAKNK